MATEKKEYSAEISDKMLAWMRSFIGKDLSQLPVECLTKLIGGTIIQADRGVFEIEVKAGKLMTNPAGFLHGGIQCAMIDDAMGWACATLGYEHQFLSTNLSVDYLGTAKAGDTVRVRAWIYREGKTLLHVVGEIKKEGVVIAKAQSNVYISGKPVNLENIQQSSGRI